MGSTECQDAARRIGKIFDRELNLSNVPSGCLLYQPSQYGDTGLNVYFNFHQNNLNSNIWNRLCKKAGFCQSRSRQSLDVGRTSRLATFCADYP